MEAILINGENDRIVCYLKLNSYLLDMFLPLFHDLNLVTLTRLHGHVVLFSVLVPPLG